MDRECSVPGCPRDWYAKGYCNAHYRLARKHPTETPEQLADRASPTGKRGRRRRTDDEVKADLLSRRVVTADGCWEWTGATDRNGYGNLRWDGKLWGVHRLAYTLLVGPVETGVEVCHRCDNPPCFNPDHLFAGSHLDNMLDAQAKGALPGNGNRIGEQNGRAKLSEADVRAIRKSTKTQVRLADDYGVGQPAISAIKLRKVWKHLAD
jgi:hypothetical protein